MADYPMYVPKDWDGFDPYLAKEQLYNFSKAVEEVYRYARFEVAKYNKKLVDNWYSKVAVSHNKKMSTPTCIASDLDYLRTKIMSSAINAIQIVAAKHGSKFEYEIPRFKSGGIVIGGGIYGYDNNFSASCFPWINLNERGKHGMGMNKEEVKIAMDELEEARDKIKTDLSKLPTDLALYDSTGELKKLYTFLIEKWSGFIAYDINQAVDTVNTCYELESNNIMQSATLAAKEFNG